MTIQVLVVDDEEIARKRIVKLLGEMNFDLQIAEASNAIEAGETIAHSTPDLIFLDINMPVYSGFDFLKQHQLESCSIIFQTAYSEYAVKAFECNADNYLLKPYTRKRFFEATEKIPKLVEERVRSKYLKFVTIKVGLLEKKIPVDQISLFKTQEKTCFLHFEGEGVLMSAYPEGSGK